MSIIDYNALPHQNDFDDDDESKILLLSSGFGGGKTYALIMKMLRLSYLNKDIPGGLLCPSMPEYKKDVLPLMEEILDDNRVKYFYHKTDKYFVFPWTKGKLYIFTAERKIRGPNLGYFGINEVGLIHYDRFKEALGRVRIKEAKHPQIVCVGTPEGKGVWTYEHFIENPRKGTRVIYGDTRKNPHLSDTYIQMLEDNYDPIMLKAYLEGQFVNMNGHQFYYAFSREKNCDKKITQIKNAPVYVGMDFNVEPMAASLWNVIGKHHQQFGEIFLANNADTQQMCDALKARGCYPENTIIFPDPSGDSRSTKTYSDIQILRNNGFFDIRFKSRAPGFRQRQLCINNLMAKGLVKVNPDTCPMSVKDWEAVEQNVVDFSKVKTNPKLTHFSDGSDYLLDYLNPLSGTKPSVVTERIR
jgi:hypothetical protein